MKPKVKLIGENGNVYNLLAICSKALKKEGYPEKAKELMDKVFCHAKSYDEALAFMCEYCDVE